MRALALGGPLRSVSQWQIFSFVVPLWKNKIRSERTRHFFVRLGPTTMARVAPFEDGCKLRKSVLIDAIAGVDLSTQGVRIYHRQLVHCLNTDLLLSILAKYPLDVMVSRPRLGTPKPSNLLYCCLTRAAEETEDSTLVGGAEDSVRCGIERFGG
ncbi:hypothetical protein ECG_03273 [Echinococcus granulosus]|nr:hypothetical protein ECG_03273 [Echinococcus granulosus]